jgi:hypothetical protein
MRGTDGSIGHPGLAIGCPYMNPPKCPLSTTYHHSWVAFKTTMRRSATVVAPGIRTGAVNDWMSRRKRRKRCS